MRREKKRRGGSSAKMKFIVVWILLGQDSHHPDGRGKSMSDAVFDLSTIKIQDYVP